MPASMSWPICRMAVTRPTFANGRADEVRRSAITGLRGPTPTHRQASTSGSARSTPACSRKPSRSSKECSMDLDELITAIERYVPQLLDEPERAARIVAACRRAWEQAEPGERFADGVARIERAAHAHSRHLLLFVDPKGELVPDSADRGWPPPDIKEVRRRGGGVTAVTRG